MVQLVIYQLNTYNAFELLLPGALVFIFGAENATIGLLMSLKIGYKLHHFY